MVFWIFSVQRLTVSGHVNERSQSNPHMSQCLGKPGILLQEQQLNESGMLGNIYLLIPFFYVVLQVQWFAGKENQTACSNKNVDSYQMNFFAKCYQALSGYTHLEVSSLICHRLPFPCMVLYCLNAEYSAAKGGCPKKTNLQIKGSDYSLLSGDTGAGVLGPALDTQFTKWVAQSALWEIRWKSI